MINWLKNKIFGNKKPSTGTDALEIKKNKILDAQEKAWALKRDDVLIDYYSNLNQIASAHSEVKRSSLYYQIKTHGTYKDDKYEVVCLKS